MTTDKTAFHDKIQKTWEAWSRGESRCPYCIGMPPCEWWVICDCFMAPDPRPDHVCDQCRPRSDDEGGIW